MGKSKEHSLDSGQAPLILSYLHPFLMCVLSAIAVSSPAALRLGSRYTLLLKEMRQKI